MYEEIERQIIEFAKRQESVWGLSRGSCPEGNYRVYYLLHEGRFDIGLCERTIDFEREIGDIGDKHFEVSQWSSDRKDLRREGFLGSIIFEKRASQPTQTL